MRCCNRQQYQTQRGVFKFHRRCVWSFQYSSLQITGKRHASLVREDDEILTAIYKDEEEIIDKS
jgi:hypothetical protein